MDWEYLLNSAAWSAGGLALGYYLGRLERRVEDIAKHTEEARDDHA